MLTFPLSALRWSQHQYSWIIPKGGSMALFYLSPNHTGKHLRLCVTSQITHWLEHYIAIIREVGSKLKFSFRILKTLVVCDLLMQLMPLCSPTAVRTGTTQGITNSHLVGALYLSRSEQKLLGKSLPFHSVFLYTTPNLLVPVFGCSLPFWRINHLWFLL